MLRVFETCQDARLNANFLFRVTSVHKKPGRAIFYAVISDNHIVSARRYFSRNRCFLKIKN